MGNSGAREAENLRKRKLGKWSTVEWKVSGSKRTIHPPQGFLFFSSLFKPLFFSEGNHLHYHYRNFSRKVESHREKKGQRRRKQIARGGRVQQYWVGLAPVWTEIAGKLQLDILFLLFPFLFLILVWLLKWNSFLTPPPPWFFIITRISSWIVFEDTVSTLSILLFFGKGNVPHCLSSFILIPLF